MKTKIFYKNRFVNVNPKEPPKDSRMLRSFLIYNNARDCFVKTAGKWFKISKGDNLIYVCRTLNHLSLEEWLEKALD